MTSESEFLRYSVSKLKQESAFIDTCIAQLTPEQVWLRGGEAQNAVGNLLLHLTGNIREWILRGVAGVAVARDRDSEFSAREGAPDVLRRDLLEVVGDAVRVIEALPEGRLVEQVRIQGHDVSVLEAIYHVVEHFSGHTGQIILLTKAFTNAELGFYSYLKNPAGAAGRKP